MDGVLVIDKPAGPTSHDVVAAARRALREKKVGHTGTLDPMATGVLPLVLGRATRLAQFLSAADKVYVAEIRLGFATDTWDAGGKPVSGFSNIPPALDRAAVEAALSGFTGSFLQAPPPFSAKKIAGARAYVLARREQPVQPKPVEVGVRSLTIEFVTGDRVGIRLECSAGFYVRSLAHEFGQRLGVGAHLSSLRRTNSGQFGLADAVTLDVLVNRPDLAIERLVPIERLLPGFPGVTVTGPGARRAAHGNTLKPGDFVPGSVVGGDKDLRVRLLDEQGALLAIARPGEVPGTLRPAVVLV